MRVRRQLTASTRVRYSARPSKGHPMLRPHLRCQVRHAARRRSALILATCWFVSITMRAVAAQESPTPSEVHDHTLHEHVAVSAPAVTPTRETSGTAWLPAATPMYGVHRPWRGWDVRLDGV